MHCSTTTTTGSQGIDSAVTRTQQLCDNLTRNQDEFVLCYPLLYPPCLSGWICYSISGTPRRLYSTVAGTPPARARMNVNRYSILSLHSPHLPVVLPSRPTARARPALHTRGGSVVLAARPITNNIGRRYATSETTINPRSLLKALLCSISTVTPSVTKNGAAASPTGTKPPVVLSTHRPNVESSVFVVIMCYLNSLLIFMSAAPFKLQNPILILEGNRQRWSFVCPV